MEWIMIFILDVQYLKWLLSCVTVPCERKASVQYISLPFITSILVSFKDLSRISGPWLTRWSRNKLILILSVQTRYWINPNMIFGISNLFNFINIYHTYVVHLGREAILEWPNLRIGETIELKRPFMVLRLNSDEY